MYKNVSNKQELTTKQKAYILSCKSALTLFFIGIISNISFMKNGFDIHQYLQNLTETEITIQKLGVLFFTGYLLSDTIIGTVYYKRFMQSLSGYIHHYVYILINIILLSNDSKWISLYMLYMISELPTFILSVGSFDNSYRKDKLFGFTFLLTRILYHAFLTWQLKSYTLPFLLSSLILCLHVYWFQNWCKKYLFKAS
jgi:hypothetical protein